ncbi:Uncharacterized protein FWK35_00031598, partial [Aphis craccivora]
MLLPNFVTKRREQFDYLNRIILIIKGRRFQIIRNSERSDVCIDFTMLCVFYFYYFYFFVSVYTRTCRNNASISNYGGGFRWQNESSWCIGPLKFLIQIFTKTRSIIIGNILSAISRRYLTILPEIKEVKVSIILKGEY